MGLSRPVMGLLYLFTVFCVLNLWILSTQIQKHRKITKLPLVQCELDTKSSAQSGLLYYFLGVLPDLLF